MSFRGIFGRIWLVEYFIAVAIRNRGRNYFVQSRNFYRSSWRSKKVVSAWNKANILPSSFSWFSSQTCSTIFLHAPLTQPCYFLLGVPFKLQTPVCRVYFECRKKKKKKNAMHRRERDYLNNSFIFISKRSNSDREIAEANIFWLRKVY